MNFKQIACLLFAVIVVLFAPLYATTRWAFGRLPFTKKVTLNESFNSYVKLIIR